MKPIYIAFIILIVAAMIVSPIVAIWTLNTLFVGVLFTAEIPLTLWTYLAMAWVLLLICSIGKSNSINYSRTDSLYK